MAGLHSLVPSIPKRAALNREEEDNANDDYCAAEADLSQCVTSSSIQDQSNSATGGSREGGTTCCKTLYTQCGSYRTG